MKSLLIDLLKTILDSRKNIYQIFNNFTMKKKNMKISMQKSNAKKRPLGNQEWKSEKGGNTDGKISEKNIHTF